MRRRAIFDLFFTVTLFCVLPIVLAAPDRRWIAYMIYVPIFLMFLLIVVVASREQKTEHKTPLIEVVEAPTTSPSDESTAIPPPNAN